MRVLTKQVNECAKVAKDSGKLRESIRQEGECVQMPSVAIGNRND